MRIPHLCICSCAWISAQTKYFAAHLPSPKIEGLPALRMVSATAAAVATSTRSLTFTNIGAHVHQQREQIIQRILWMNNGEKNKNAVQSQLYYPAPSFAHDTSRQTKAQTNKGTNKGIQMNERNKSNQKHNISPSPLLSRWLFAPLRPSVSETTLRPRRWRQHALRPPQPFVEMTQIFTTIV